MNESILDYIKNTYTVEMQEVLMKGLELFKRLNIDSYEGFILNTLNRLEDSDPDHVASNIIYYIEGLCVQLELSFGFKLQDQGSVTLEQRIDFIRGYVDLEDYIDHQTVIRIIETDMAEAEKLAEAVALTTGYGVETLMSFIDSVDEAALVTLSRLHQGETPAQEKEEEIQPPDVSEDQVRQVRAFELFIREHHLEVECFNLIRIGMPIGAPYNLYWSMQKDQILAADRAKFSVEIIGLFLLSREHWSNPLLAFEGIKEELFDTTQVISEVTVAVRELMGGFMKFKAENKIK